MKLLSLINITKQYSIFSFMFLFLLGTHLVDYPWIFILSALLIINWEQIKKWESLLVLAFTISIFITWYFLDHSILFNVTLIGQITLIFIMFMIGLSIPFVQNNTLKDVDKNLFYFLFIFFLGYLSSIIYSYIFIPQENPLTFHGMYMCFQNEYKRTYVNNGMLISTIITYYLTFLAILVPFLLLYFKNFIQHKFNTIELLLLFMLSSFSIFITAQMGRRTTMVLIVVILLYLLFNKIIESSKKLNLKMIFLILTSAILLLSLGYYFLEDTSAIQRLLSRGFHDRRFGLWIKGIHIMIEYPFGGGYDIILENFSKLAHNTWIDIGKDLGVTPFILLILLSIIFTYNIISIHINNTMSIFMKHILTMQAIVLFTIFMIEPVFNSDKTFFTYGMFLLGVVIALNSETREIT